MGEPANQSADARELLHSVFGFQEYRGLQEAIVEALLQGRDALVLMPTGGGKSLCFQLPAMVREGVGVVISPLIALMQDQVETLRQAGVRARALNSSMDAAFQRQVEQELQAGELDLLYLAPERLLRNGTLAQLERAKLALIAIDEAHCVSQWGHDFRPEYLRLSMLAKRFPGVPRIALTATADEPTRREIVEKLDLSDAQRFISSFDRPNITYRVRERRNGKQQLLRLIRERHPGESGIVYCLSRQSTEDTAEWLCAQGLTALPYHAGLGSELREKHQRRFLQEDDVIIVATIAFGMGIDKPDVRFVAHLDLPASIEAYYQETGRAGRDGLPAEAWLLYGLQDVVRRRQMLERSEADEARKRVERSKLDAILGFCELTGCRRQSLLRYFGETLAEPCGNCDNCLEPPETWDATEEARMALSAVYRSGQNFGVAHIIDILRGGDTEKIRRFGHKELSTYGIGDHLSTREWRSVLRQLIARGLLEVDVSGYGALFLTEACRSLLRGEQTLELRREKRGSAKSARSSGSLEIEAADQPLWEALRTRRRELAEEQAVPPYVIFHDATLLQMLKQRPATLAEMADISGIGQTKLERYGSDFLQVIAEAETPA